MSFRQSIQGDGNRIDVLLDQHFRCLLINQHAVGSHAPGEAHFIYHGQEFFQLRIEQRFASGQTDLRKDAEVFLYIQKNLTEILQIKIVAVMLITAGTAVQTGQITAVGQFKKQIAQLRMPGEILPVLSQLIEIFQHFRFHESIIAQLKICHRLRMVIIRYLRAQGL